MIASKCDFTLYIKLFKENRPFENRDFLKFVLKKNKNISLETLGKYINLKKKALWNKDTPSEEIKNFPGNGKVLKDLTIRGQGEIMIFYQKRRIKSWKPNIYFFLQFCLQLHIKLFTHCEWVSTASWDVALREMSTCGFLFCCGLFLLKQKLNNNQKYSLLLNFTLSKKTSSMGKHLSNVCCKSNNKKQWFIRPCPVTVLWARIHKIKAADGIPKFNLLFDLSLCYHSEM